MPPMPPAKKKTKKKNLSMAPHKMLCCPNIFARLLWMLMLLVSTVTEIDVN